MLRFDRQKVLGVGGFGTVYQGVWGETKVAVKRIVVGDAATTEQEEKALKMLDHTNVIKLFHVEEDQDFKYFKNQTVFKLEFLKFFSKIILFIEVSPLNCVMPR